MFCGQRQFIATLVCCSALSWVSPAMAQLVPGTGEPLVAGHDDFEDPNWGYVYNLPKASSNIDKQQRLPSGGSTNGKWLESTFRGTPDSCRRVVTPPGGLPGSTAAMSLRTLNSGIPGVLSGKFQQDDLIANMSSQVGGYLPVSLNPSFVVRVYLQPFDRWEKRSGSHFGFRADAQTVLDKPSKSIGGLFRRATGGTTREIENYWPGFFFQFERKADGYAEDAAVLLIRSGDRGQDIPGPRIKEPGWWTLGLSFTPDGRVHYYARPGVENLTQKDHLLSVYPYSYKCMQVSTYFFNVVNQDDGRTWSTEFIVDDPRAYIIKPAGNQWTPEIASLKPAAAPQVAAKPELPAATPQGAATVPAQQVELGGLAPAAPSANTPAQTPLPSAAAPAAPVEALPKAAALPVLPQTAPIAPAAPTAPSATKTISLPQSVPDAPEPKAGPSAAVTAPSALPQTPAVSLNGIPQAVPVSATPTLTPPVSTVPPSSVPATAAARSATRPQLSTAPKPLAKLPAAPVPVSTSGTPSPASAPAAVSLPTLPKAPEPVREEPALESTGEPRAAKATSAQPISQSKTIAAPSANSEPAATTADDVPPVSVLPLLTPAKEAGSSPATVEPESPTVEPVAKPATEPAPALQPAPVGTPSATDGRPLPALPAANPNPQTTKRAAASTAQLQSATPPAAESLIEGLPALPGRAANFEATVPLTAVERPAVPQQAATAAQANTRRPIVEARPLVGGPVAISPVSQAETGTQPAALPADLQPTGPAPRPLRVLDTRKPLTFRPNPKLPPLPVAPAPIQ